MGHSEREKSVRCMYMYNLINPDTYKQEGVYRFEDVTGELVDIDVGRLIGTNGYYRAMRNRRSRYMSEEMAIAREIASLKHSGFEILRHSVDKHGVVRAKKESGKLAEDIKRWETAARYNAKAKMLRRGLVTIINNKIAYMPDTNMENAVIPSIIEDIRLADVSWLRSRTTLKTLNIQADIKSIPTRMLMYSTLESVTFNDGLKSIGAFAFASCNIEKLVFPKGLNKISASAFANCMGLKEVEFNGPLMFLGKEAFEGCRSLERIKLPNGIPDILPGTFASCRSLKYVFIPKSVRTVHPTAFSNVPMGSLVIEAPEHLRSQLTFIPYIKVRFY